MNKKNLIKEYRKKLPMIGEIKKFKEAEMDFEIFFKTLKIGLLREGEIKLRGKGKFMILQKKERAISNPSTRERMIINPPKTIKFVLSKKVLDEINKASK